MRTLLFLNLLLIVGLWGCQPVPEETSPCGPTRGQVANVHDGDTFTLASGEKIRLLMVDTPEIGKNAECHGDVASTFSKNALQGKEVKLRYDVQCTDRFGRLLAYVTVDGVELNVEIIKQGLGCMLFIEPNGVDRREEFQQLEDVARSEAQGLWGVCSKEPC